MVILAVLAWLKEHAAKPVPWGAVIVTYLAIFATIGFAIQIGSNGRANIKKAGVKQDKKLAAESKRARTDSLKNQKRLCRVLVTITEDEAKSQERAVPLFRPLIPADKLDAAIKDARKKTAKLRRLANSLDCNNLEINGTKAGDLR